MVDAIRASKGTGQPALVGSRSCPRAVAAVRREASHLDAGTDATCWCAKCNISFPFPNEQGLKGGFNLLKMPISRPSFFVLGVQAPSFASPLSEPFPIGPSVLLPEAVPKLIKRSRTPPYFYPVHAQRGFKLHHASLKSTSTTAAAAAAAEYTYTRRRPRLASGSAIEVVPCPTAS